VEHLAGISDRDVLHRMGMVGPRLEGVTEEKSKRQNERDWQNFVDVS
jgi:hypothetical protein